jgi:hypothetical protein
MATTEIISYTKDEDFEQASKEFRAHWNIGREAARNAANKINDMVSILSKQYPNWSINKIPQKIYIKHEELDGFTTRTIYNNLNESNRMLLDSSKQERKKKVTEQSVETFQHKDIEDSLLIQISQKRKQMIFLKIFHKKEKKSIFQLLMISKNLNQ